MNEPRLRDVLTGVDALRRRLAVDAGETMADVQLLRSWHGTTDEIINLADRMEQRALEMASGLERLDRLVAAAGLEETQPMHIDEVVS